MLQAALRYMVYGKSQQFDVDRMIDMLQALEKFVAIKEDGDGTAFKVRSRHHQRRLCVMCDNGAFLTWHASPRPQVDGVRGDTDLGSAGSMVGTRTLAAPRGALAEAARAPVVLGDAGDASRLSAQGQAEAQASKAREALRFFFSEEGESFRAFLLDEVRPPPRAATACHAATTCHAAAI